MLPQLPPVRGVGVTCCVSLVISLSMRPILIVHCDKACIYSIMPVPLAVLSWLWLYPVHLVQSLEYVQDRNSLKLPFVH